MESLLAEQQQWLITDSTSHLGECGLLVRGHDQLQLGPAGAAMAQHAFTGGMQASDMLHLGLLPGPQQLACVSAHHADESGLQSQDCLTHFIT